MISSLLLQYAKLTGFLGHALGHDYEVVLHDLTDGNNSIIAIANNHVSKRKIGEHISQEEIDALKARCFENELYCFHMHDTSVKGKVLRSSSLFIREYDKDIGLLCINFDDSRYQNISMELLGLCHPDAFVGTHFQIDEDRVLKIISNNTSATNLNSVSENVDYELRKLGISAERLTAAERQKIIFSLESKGVFRVKGAVKEAAAGLHCSQASIYRYLAQIK